MDVPIRSGHTSLCCTTALQASTSDLALGDQDQLGIQPQPVHRPADSTRKNLRSNSSLPKYSEGRLRKLDSPHPGDLASAA